MKDGRVLAIAAPTDGTSFFWRDTLMKCCRLCSQWHTAIFCLSHSNCAQPKWRWPEQVQFSKHCG